jgi:hypothetical protein
MDDSFRTHWPLPSGLDFAKGDFSSVVSAVATEVRRFIGREPLSEEKLQVRGMAGQA